MPRVLLISKAPLARRIDGAVLERLFACGGLDAVRVERAMRNHDAARRTVLEVLAGCDVHDVPLDVVVPADAVGCDVIVTVGGDGTVLAANALGADCPLITVNSDPGGSIGVFTRCNASSVADLVVAWRSGRAVVEEIPRLAVQIADQPLLHVLNDCLFASTNPAAMTRYVVQVDGASERQRSSGVWIATAAGSTAAIHSAGLAPVSCDQPALLFKVREPFHGHHPLAVLEGVQRPPRDLRLIPAMPDVVLYIDGSHQRHVLPPGSVVDFTGSPIPLRLLRLG
jgi:NAD+ kinase